MKLIFLSFLVIFPLDIESRKNYFIKLKREECKAFENFMLKFNKTYSTDREFFNRRIIFTKNLRIIKKQNKVFDIHRATFNCSINQYADLTSDEFREILITKPKFASRRLTTTKKSEKKSLGFNFFNLFNFGWNGMKNHQTKVRESVDWRKTAVTPVIDQGLCGSCWTFSAAGAIEGQIYIKTNRLMKVSAQHFLDCVTTKISIGCSGGLMTDAFDYATRNGIIEDKNYPYEGSQNKLKCIERKPKISGVKVEGFVQLPSGDEEELAKAVKEIGPISVGIDASWQSLQFYESGVYFESKCSSEQINHAVLVVGYGSDEELGEYWIVKNSWGKSWGSDGYFHLAKNRKNHCGIATDASYPKLIKT